MDLRIELIKVLHKSYMSEKKLRPGMEGREALKRRLAVFLMRVTEPRNTR